MRKNNNRKDYNQSILNKYKNIMKQINDNLLQLCFVLLIEISHLHNVSDIQVKNMFSPLREQGPIK